MRLSIVLLLAGPLLVACAHPTAFRPARTLEKGRFEHALGLQAGTMVPSPNGTDGVFGEVREGRSYLRPFTPTYALRYGLTDRLEIGAEAGVIHLRAEATFNLIQSRYLDLALGADLGIGSTPILHDDLEGSWQQAGLTAAVPFLVGFNPFPWLALVGHAGPASAGGVWAAQVGGGIDFLAIPGFAIRPHLSYLFADQDQLTYFRRQEEGYLPHLLFGLDLAFGH